jgi:hypothetical protein
MARGLEHPKMVLHARGVPLDQIQIRYPGRSEGISVNLNDIAKINLEEGVIQVWASLVTNLPHGPNDCKPFERNTQHLFQPSR